MPLSTTGYFVLVLHAHLPFVRHPEYNDPLEERWLHEAITECYLPLLRVLDGWRRDGVPARLALSLSPTLIAMLDDELLRGRYLAHLTRLIDLAQKELWRTRLDNGLQPVARHYFERLRACRDAWEWQWRGDLVGAFHGFVESGHVELLTATATHAFLPLHQHQPLSARAQVRVAADVYRARFGLAPGGLWNAECGYHPGLDRAFLDAGFRYFFVDAHALGATPEAALRRHALVRSPAGACVLARDVATSREVWDARVGYPGDPVYREFYRDAGFDLECDYIAPYIHESGARIATGFKYHRVTGGVGLAEKQLYEPEAAERRAREHARHFVHQRRRQCAELSAVMAGPPAVVAMYDAELFGHWWYEGPVFLDEVMRELARREPGAPGPIALTPLELISRHAPAMGGAPAFDPGFSSWGEGGYAWVWLNPDNDWLYPLLHDATRRMSRLADRHRRTRSPMRRRALDQMARELMLAQSSDWPFMISMRRTAEYAERRARDHLAAFDRLAEGVAGPRTTMDPDFLRAREAQYNLFPQLSFEVFA